MNYNEAFPSKYWRVSDLEGKEVQVMVTSVEFETIGNERKLVAQFKGHDKALPLNKTNAATFAKLAESANTDKWAGVRAVLFPSEVFFQGEMKDCIRVKAARFSAPLPDAPQSLEEVKPAF